ncbi:MAG: hypothetical protein WDW38_000920 [Sanguina aurantia]
MTTSALLWGAGDAIGQRLAEPHKPGVDCRRAALTAAFGGGFIGPIGHVWYASLDTLCARFGAPGTLRLMVAKVIADNIIYGSLYIAAFFAFGVTVIDRQGMSEFVARMRSDFLPTMLAELAVWPPYMALIFSKVPVPHQLLATNFMTLFDVAFLSYISTQDAAWPETLASALKRNTSHTHAPRLVQNLHQQAAPLFDHTSHVSPCILFPHLLPAGSPRRQKGSSSSASSSEEQGTEPAYELYSHPLSPARVGVAPGQGFTSNSRWGRRLHSKRLPHFVSPTEVAQLTLRDSLLRRGGEGCGGTS